MKLSLVYKKRLNTHNYNKDKNYEHVPQDNQNEAIHDPLESILRSLKRILRQLWFWPLVRVHVLQCRITRRHAPRHRCGQNKKCSKPVGLPLGLQLYKARTGDRVHFLKSEPLRQFDCKFSEANPGNGYTRCETKTRYSQIRSGLTANQVRPTR